MNKIEKKQKDDELQKRFLHYDFSRKKPRHPSQAMKTDLEFEDEFTR